MSTEQQTLDESTVEEHECPECDRSFTTKVGLSSHKSQSHDESGPYICPKCEDEFSTENGMKSHHYQAHGESIGGELRECDECHKEYRGKKTNREQDYTFCSRDCFYDHHSGSNHSQWKGGPRTRFCDTCSDKIEVYPSRDENSDVHYCSRECFGVAHTGRFTGEDNNFWDGGREEVMCEWCESKKEVKPKTVRRNENHFCDGDCYGSWRSENVVGSSHPQWKSTSLGSVYESIRDHLGDEYWGDISQKHRTKNNQCRKCGGNSNLETHHIIPIMCGGTNGKYNRMTICTSCHRSVEDYTQNLINPVISNVVSKSTSSSEN